MTTIETYDATLRDGMQGEGMSLTAAEKVRVVHKLDELGVDLIEAGFPASNPKELELFALLEREPLQHAQIAAFGMTRRRDVAAEDDEALRLLADSFAPVCTLVGKTWSLHLEKVVRVGRDENLRMIADSVAFLVREGKTVVYDGEHFFDAWRDDADYALRCVRAAAEAGAAWVTLGDTNGASLPHEVEDATAASEFATPHSASLCVWMPTGMPVAATARTASATTCGSEAPLVSHSVTFSAPASKAARAQRSAYAASSR